MEKQQNTCQCNCCEHPNGTCVITCVCQCCPSSENQETEKEE